MPKYKIKVMNCGMPIIDYFIEANRLDFWIEDNSITYRFLDNNGKEIRIINVPTSLMSHLEVENA